MHTLDVLGSGVLLAWIALPVLMKLGRPRIEADPVSAYRNLLATLLLSTACVALPWIRACLPRVTDRLSPVHLTVRVLATTETPELAGGARFAVSPFGLLAVAWVLACAITCARWLVARWRLGRLLARCVAPPRALQCALDARADALGIKRPRLLLSPDAGSPFSARVFAPVIVVPVMLTEELEPERLDLVLQHELAHVRRRDPLTNAVARACAAVFTLHPSVPALLKELAMAREASVDAEVAPQAPHAYATLLVEMASHVRFGKELAHVSMDDTALARRIAMLTNETHVRKPSSAALILGAGAIAALGLLAPRVFADEARNQVFYKHAEGEPAPHDDEIRACYDQARQEKADLQIDTIARLDLDANFKVTSASVPTPASPTFQQCVEQKALSWTFPPPPDMPPPPKDMPKDAKRMVAFHIQLHP